MKLQTVTFCLLLLISFTSCGTETSQRLWDREPTLFEIARTVIIERPFHLDYPQPEGIHFTKSYTPNLSTPRMRMSLWGPPDRLTLSMGKTDVWDRRKGWQKPVTLDEIRRGAFSPANKDDEPLPGWEDKHGQLMVPEGGFRAHNASREAYSFPTAKPVGQVIFRADDFNGIEQPTGETDCHSGITTVSLNRGDTQATIEYLPLMSEATIAIRADYRGLTRPVSVRLYRHRDTLRDGRYLADSNPRLDGYDYEKDAAWNGPLDPPESGKDGAYFWIHQTLPAEKTFPDGFEYYLVGTVTGQDATIEIVDGEFHLGTPSFKPKSDRWEPGDYASIREAPGSAATALLPDQKDLQFTVLVTIVTTNDGSNLMDIARRRLESAKRRGMESLIAENSGWYRDHYDRREHGRIFTGSVEDTRRRIPALYRSWTSAHTQETTPDPTRYEADSWYYSFLEQDGSPWHGLQCHNEIYFTSESVQNRSDRVESYVKLVNFWLDASRKNAREVFGLPGMYMGAGYIPPIKPDEYPNSCVSLGLAMCTTGMVIKPLWDTWDYGGDEAFLREKVYTPLKDLATFYTAYVQKWDDGFYHVQPTVAQERWGITYQFKYNTDATASLAMIKWTLIRAAEAAELLGLDSDLQAQWLEIAGNLAPYSTVPSPDGPVLPPVPGDTNPSSRHSGKLAPANLADEINLDSDPADIELALRTARHIRERDTSMVFHLLGADPGIAHRWYPKNCSWGYFYSGQRDTLDTHDACVDAYWTEPERLLNSRSGRIHLFPCVQDSATVAFKDFQARNGFLVSAEYRSGETMYASITSRRDVPCRLANPWPSHMVTVIRERDGSRVDAEQDPVHDDGIVFQARSGESYSIVKSQ